MLVDYIKTSVRSGKGGDGVIHWHREKYIAKGGPDGGNGGEGGNVYAEAIRDINALSHFVGKKIFSARDGMSGGRANKTGKKGEDLTIKVPVGSYIKNLTTDEVFDLDVPGKKVLLAAGGQGGLGNNAFKSSHETTPYKKTDGEPAQEYDLLIELKMIADIGLIGFPNAGKTTFLNSVTNASGKVAAYPFTTKDPNLGVYHNHIIADIPGIIEGASEGRGLGFKFLRHISRARTLAHLISLQEHSNDICAAYGALRKELKEHSLSLIEKPEVIILTKKDTVSDESSADAIKQIKSIHKDALIVSAYDDASMKNAIDECVRMVNEMIS